MPVILCPFPTKFQGFPHQVSRVSPPSFRGFSPSFKGFPTKFQGFPHQVSEVSHQVSRVSPPSFKGFPTKFQGFLTKFQGFPHQVSRVSPSFKAFPPSLLAVCQRLTTYSGIQTFPTCCCRTASPRIGENAGILQRGNGHEMAAQGFTGVCSSAFVDEYVPWRKFDYKGIPQPTKRKGLGMLVLPQRNLVGSWWLRLIGHKCHQQLVRRFR